MIIRSFGHALPKRIVTNDELARFLDTSDEWIQSHTGIQSRRVLTGGETLSALGAQAATIYKTPDAGLVGQGLSGTLDMQTVRPLNFKERTVSINLRDVVMDMEHVLCPVDCKRENCRLSGGCRIQGILRRAMNAFLEVLGEYTLADAVRDPTRLCHLLGIEQDNILTMA